MRIQAVIFDLGNVLVFHDNELLFRRMAARAGCTVEALRERVEGELWERINRGQLMGDAIRKEICQRLGAEIPADEFFELFSCHFTPNHEVFPYIERLAGRVKLLLLSNTNDLHARYLLPRLPLLSRFDALLLSHELGLVKPEPEIFLRALEVAGTRPEATAFFDDLPEFVEAARRLGIHGVVVRDARQLPRQLEALGL